MTLEEQRRAMVLTKVASGELTVAEAASADGPLGAAALALACRLRAEGPAGLVHGNRGRASPRRLAEDRRARILELAAGRYAGVNDSHLAELLAEREGIKRSRVSVRRILRAAGIASPRTRRPPWHRSRRELMPAAGMLLHECRCRSSGWPRGRPRRAGLGGWTLDRASRCAGARPGA